MPYFQDTYGWILHRRGDSDQALGYLAPAAAALPGNALVQFHLAETELALEPPRRGARQLRPGASPPPRPAARCRSSPRSASAWPRSTRRRRPDTAPATDAGPAIKG